MVHPRVFDGAAYVALGHLHGRQQITDTVRYSGSPVAMSFSEATHTKGSWLVDLDTAGVRVQQVEAPVLRPLAVLRGDLSHLLEHGIRRGGAVLVPGDADGPGPTPRGHGEGQAAVPAPCRSCSTRRVPRCR